MAKWISRYGNEMVLIHGETARVIRAFLQDTRSRSMENAQREFSPLGELFKGRFVYLGPVEPTAAVGDTLQYQGRLFELRRAEPVCVGDRAAYIWGLCVEKDAERNGEC